VAVPDPALRERNGEAPGNQGFQPLYAEMGGCEMKDAGGVLSVDRRPDRLLRTETSESRASGSSTSVEPDRVGAWPEELDQQFYAEGSMAIPGKGEPGENCGTWAPRQFCDECGEPHFGASVCEQRTCPDCWGAWTRRRAEKITRRLGAAREAPEGLEKRAVHAVASPPEGEIQTLTDVYDGYRDAYRLIEEMGVRGGVCIFHGFRVRDEAKGLFEQAKERGKWETERDGKLWAFVRSREKRIERGIGEGKEWRGLTYWSPHYHVLGLCEDFDEDTPDEQSGWVARRIRSLDEFHLHDDRDDEESYSDMVRAARYLLSHAVFETDTSKDCVRWFGELATTKFVPEEEVAEGSLSVIERKAREAAESHEKRGEGNEQEECDGCGATSLSSIFEAGGALLDEGWCSRVGREQERRLKAAFEWAIGDRLPPPGLKNPRTEEEAREAFEAML